MLERFSLFSVQLAVIGITQNVKNCKKSIDTDLDYFCSKAFKNHKDLNIGPLSYHGYCFVIVVKLFLLIL